MVHKYQNFFKKKTFKLSYKSFIINKVFSYNTIKLYIESGDDYEKRYAETTPSYKFKKTTA